MAETRRLPLLDRVSRGLTGIVRLTAPVWHLARRGVTGRYWRETVVVNDTPGPDLAGGDEPGVAEPDDGVGPLYLRSYRVTIGGATMTAEELLATFARDPNRFCPTSYARFEPSPGPAGLQPGDELTVTLPGPWNGPVRVTTVSDDAIRLDTLNGHLEAGAIEFRTRALGPGSVEFRIRSQARSANEVVDTLYSKLRMAKLVQSQMWAQVLEAAVEVAGGRRLDRLQFETIVYTGDQP